MLTEGYQVWHIRKTNTTKQYKNNDLTSSPLTQAFCNTC